MKELDSLVQRIRIFNKGMGMDFSTEKCATERKSVGIELPDGKVLWRIAHKA